MSKGKLLLLSTDAKGLLLNFPNAHEEQGMQVEFQQGKSKYFNVPKRMQAFGCPKRVCQPSIVE